jgi:hypothetical protein
MHTLTNTASLGVQKNDFVFIIHEPRPPLLSPHLYIKKGVSWLCITGAQAAAAAAAAT